MEKDNKADAELSFVRECVGKVLDGGILDAEALYRLAEIGTPAATEALTEGAAAVTRRFSPRKFDSCSIVNARSGLCSENCKWCAQSRHYSTGCDTYAFVDEDLAHREARYNAAKGIGRISLVASGRAVKGKAMDAMAALLRDIADNDGISTCASMGLLGKEELQKLWDAGVRRYHCNLETAPSYFGELCTTHTIKDKMRTIRTAREIGFEVCSGGIIGMGETRRQRVELALKLREVEPQSIPINILCPIPGTPLGDMEPISEEEIIITIALFRLAHPRIQIRFAGGRSRLSHHSRIKALRTGINGGIVGDLLTTTGSTIDEDKALVAEAGYDF